MSAPVHRPSPTDENAAQWYSHFPAIPAPLRVPLTVLPLQPCPYFSERPARLRAIQAHRLDAEIYQQFMDAGFRRSGRMLYQPICPGCRDCRPIRLATYRFELSRSQRRCARKNADLSVRVVRPAVSAEKHALYCRYLLARHDGKQDDSSSAFASFLYDSPTTSLEFEYRLPDGTLVACGLCDVSRRSLSSVYYYFDPTHSRRGLGTFGVLCEIDYARRVGIPHYYLGYWVQGAPTMQYKMNFHPNELLCGDGLYRPSPVDDEELPPA
jgi:arginine-tRNA-protein transferase